MTLQQQQSAQVNCVSRVASDERNKLANITWLANDGCIFSGRDCCVSLFKQYH